MDVKGLKKLIKEAVREAIQEEIKEILLEAVRAPKGTPVGHGGFGTVTENIAPAPAAAKPATPQGPSVRDKYASLLEGMAQSRNGNLNMTSADAQTFGGSIPYVPPASANTAGEGSALPPGEVSLDQVMSLIKKR